MVTGGLPAARLMNFADESTCLTADNAWNEVVTIHRSQEVLKMLSLYTWMLSTVVLLKNRGATILLALKPTRQKLSVDGAGLHGTDVDSLNPSKSYFV
jgi:hypothetical protein